MEQQYFTGNMPLLTINQTFRTCGGPEAFTHPTIFMKCCVKLAQEDKNATSSDLIRSGIPYPSNFFIL